MIRTIIWSWIVVLDIGRTLGITTFLFLLLLIPSTPSTETFLAGQPMVRTHTFEVDKLIVIDGCECQVGDQLGGLVHCQ
jgi:hypothetical protein